MGPRSVISTEKPPIFQGFGDTLTLPSNPGPNMASLKRPRNMHVFPNSCSEPFSAATLEGRKRLPTNGLSIQDEVDGFLANPDSRTLELQLFGSLESSTG